ncbi:MAG: hypothetical protein ABJ327_27060 [Litoreibacter sp.]
MPAHPNPDSFQIMLIRLPSYQVRENRQAPPATSVPVENSGSSHAQAESGRWLRVARMSGEQMGWMAPAPSAS